MRCIWRERKVKFGAASLRSRLQDQWVRQEGWGCTQRGVTYVAADAQKRGFPGTFMVRVLLCDYVCECVVACMHVCIHFCRFTVLTNRLGHWYARVHIYNACLYERVSTRTNMLLLRQTGPCVYEAMYSSVGFYLPHQAKTVLAIGHITWDSAVAHRHVCSVCTVFVC
jgi:hypothetical protein